MNGQWYPLSDNLVTELRLRLAAADFEKVTKDNARDAMFYVCDENKFDSAQRWLTAQEWDGKPRVSYFFERCFKCQGDRVPGGGQPLHLDGACRARNESRNQGRHGSAAVRATGCPQIDGRSPYVAIP